MKVQKITGDFDTMEVVFEDGRVVEIWGELLVYGFVAYENTIEKWKNPEGEPISESEKQEIIDAVNEKQKNTKMKITFETYREPTESEKEESERELFEEMKQAGFYVEEIE